LEAAGSAESTPVIQDQTLTIREAIRMAQSHSPEVALAEARAVRSGEALREIRSLNRPQVVTGTGLAYNNGFPLSIEGSAPSLIQVGASQAIFSKRNKNLIRATEESSKASRLDPQTVRRQLASRTALIYNELHQSAKIIALWSERLTAAQIQQQRQQELLAAGKTRQLEVMQSQQAVAAARQQLLVAREQQIIAAAELRILTGLPDGFPLRTADPQIESDIFALPDDELYRQALENTTAILQAEAEVASKEFAVEAAKGEKWPQLDIISQYALFSRSNNYDDFFNRFTRNNFILGLSVQLPLFDGNRSGARVAQSRQEAAEARFHLQRIKSELKLDVQRGSSGLRVAQGALQVARGDIAAAEENLRLGEILFAAGKLSARELDDCRRLLHERKLALLETDRILRQRKIEILLATGAILNILGSPQH
jgi:outer membrane protein